MNPELNDPIAERCAEEEARVERAYKRGYDTGRREAGDYGRVQEICDLKDQLTTLRQLREHEREVWQAKDREIAKAKELLERVIGDTACEEPESTILLMEIREFLQ